MFIFSTLYAKYNNFKQSGQFLCILRQCATAWNTGETGEIHTVVLVTLLNHLNTGPFAIFNSVQGYYNDSVPHVKEACFYSFKKAVKNY